MKQEETVLEEAYVIMLQACVNASKAMPAHVAIDRL